MDRASTNASASALWSHICSEKYFFISSYFPLNHTIVSSLPGGVPRTGAMPAGATNTAAITAITGSTHMNVPSSFLLPAVRLSLYTGQPKNTRFPADPSLLLTWILLPFQHQVHLAREPGHYGLVRPHHVEELAPGGEAGLVVAGAGGRLGLDGPSWRRRRAAC